MSISKRDEWYKDRIEWRTKRHGLGLSGWYFFAGSDSESTKFIVESVQFSGLPVLLFWDSERLWTLITSREIVSCIDSQLARLPLDEIGKWITPRSSELEAHKGKLEIDRIFVGPMKMEVWAPKGESLFALWNILKMFPLHKGYEG